MTEHTLGASTDWCDGQTIISASSLLSYMQGLAVSATFHVAVEEVEQLVIFKCSLTNC